MAAGTEAASTTRASEPVAPSAQDGSSTRAPLPVLLALLLATTLVLSLSDHADPDLWGHVRYGADALAAGRLPATTTYAYTAVGHPWINHEWVSELVFATAARYGGGLGLTLFKTALGLGLFALIIAMGGRQRVALPALAVTVTVAAVSVSPGWSVRPQIFGFAAFALLIVLLDRAFLRPRHGALWPIPLLFVAWVNLHASFVAGLAVLAVYLGATVLERAIRRDPLAGRDARRALVVALASSLAILCTPYGLAFVPWVADAVTLHRPAISEWNTFTSADPRFGPFLVLVMVVAAGWIGTRRRRPLAHTAVLLVVAWVSIRHARHAPFLGLLAALWLPPHVQSLLERWSPPRPPSRPPVAIQAAAWATVALLLLAVAARTRAPWVDAGVYPVDAFAYMRAHHLTGRLIAHFDWAQYALYAFAPATSVQFDGRFETAYDDVAADMHFDFLLGDRPERPVVGAPERVLDVGHPELVLLSRRYPQPTRIMRERADWSLLYQDALAELWGARAKYDDPDSVDFVAVRDRSISEQSSAARRTWPAVP